MNGVTTTGPQDPAAKDVNTDGDTESAGVTDSGRPDTALVEDHGASPQASPQPAGSAESVSDEFPRKRRGILLGTHPGAATPAASDDEKSLSWMATQAVKAANAVKASQLEQAQAWKAGAGMSEDEQTRLAEDDIAAIDTGESVAMERQEPVQSSPGEAPATTEAVPPVESSQAAVTTPRIPPGARAAAPRVPARMALMLGVLVMFGYAGYRHWFAGDRAASDVPATPSAIIESTGPAEAGKLMTPPPVSVVAAPEPAAGHSTPPANEAEMPPPPVPATATQPATAGLSVEPAAPAAEEVKLMTPPPVSVVAAPEPAAGHSTPPADEAETAPPPVPATDAQPATARVPGESTAAAVAPQEAAAGNTPQAAPVNPESAMQPQAWYPAAVPASPSPAAETDMAARPSAPPSSPPPVEADVTARQPAPSSSPPPAVEASVPARQPVTPVPAARPGYPANGYGYYQPPSAWQPYYRPGYPQAPPRQ